MNRPGSIAKRIVLQISILSWLLGSSAPAAATEFRTVAELRDAVIAAMRQHDQYASVEADASDDGLILLEIDGHRVTSDVGNFFDYLKAYPGEDARELIARFAATPLESAQAMPDAERLVPLVRSRDYVEALKGDGVEIDAEPVAGDLFLLYGFDNPDSVAAATGEEIASLGLQDHRAKALANLLAAMNGSMYEDGEGEIVMFSIENSPPLASGLLILEDFWERVQPRFPGGALAINPRRDQIFLIDKRSPDALGLARRMIDATFADGFNLQSRGIFERVDGRLAHLETH